MGFLLFLAFTPAMGEETAAGWPRFLGPADDCTSPETGLIDSFPETGPPLSWQRPKGSGYTSPVFADGVGVMFDRFGDEEVVEAFQPDTGEVIWRVAYPVEYTDRYGFNNGPRASAVLSEGKCYTIGVTGVLTCLSVADGAQIWQRDLDADYQLADSFFGHGACPVVFDGKIIINLGAAEDLCVLALDSQTGEEVWRTTHQWRASYSSPVVKKLGGEPVLLVLAGGESRPSFGGLMAIDPATGEIYDTFPWRSDKYESVNSSGPIVVGDDRVFISECYSEGGTMLRLTADKKLEQLWHAPGFNLHWMTPVQDSDTLYGFLGRNEPDAYLGAFDIETGGELWKKDIIWPTDIGGRPYRLSYFRGSILAADSKYWILGELGTLALMELDREGYREISRAQLFHARSTWSLPVLYQGRLYVSQHEAEFPFIEGGSGPRLLCYDLRKK